MNDPQEARKIGGHLVLPAGHDKNMPTSAQTLYRCVDCHTITTHIGLIVGTQGCPARPESLDYLSVCPGGDHCPGHPDTDSPEWRAFARSNSLPLDTVPRITCPASELGVRAADQYLAYANKLGLRMSAWAQGAAASASPQGGIVAEFTFDDKNYAVHVDRRGKITAFRYGA